ncbi:MAG: hypothetical protein C0601_01860, partial [Candidatus Muiribacterium halophilum]
VEMGNGVWPEAEITQDGLLCVNIISSNDMYRTSPRKTIFIIDAYSWDSTEISSSCSFIPLTNNQNNEDFTIVIPKKSVLSRGKYCLLDKIMIKRDSNGKYSYKVQDKVGNNLISNNGDYIPSSEELETYEISEIMNRQPELTNYFVENTRIVEESIWNDVTPAQNQIVLSDISGKTFAKDLTTTKSLITFNTDGSYSENYIINSGSSIYFIEGTYEVNNGIITKTIKAVDNVAYSSVSEGIKSNIYEENTTSDIYYSSSVFTGITDITEQYYQKTGTFEATILGADGELKTSQKLEFPNELEFLLYDTDSDGTTDKAYLGTDTYEVSIDNSLEFIKLTGDTYIYKIYRLGESDLQDKYLVEKTDLSDSMIDYFISEWDLSSISIHTPLLSGKLFHMGEIDEQDQYLMYFKENGDLDVYKNGSGEVHFASTTWSINYMNILSIGTIADDNFSYISSKDYSVNNYSKDTGETPFYNVQFDDTTDLENGILISQIQTITSLENSMTYDKHFTINAEGQSPGTIRFFYSYDFTEYGFSFDSWYYIKNVSNNATFDGISQSTRLFDNYIEVDGLEKQIYIFQTLFFKDYYKFKGYVVITYDGTKFDSLRYFLDADYENYMVHGNYMD